MARPTADGSGLGLWGFIRGLGVGVLGFRVYRGLGFRGLGFTDGSGLGFRVLGFRV